MKTLKLILQLLANLFIIIGVGLIITMVWINDEWVFKLFLSDLALFFTVVLYWKSYSFDKDKEP